MPKGRVSKVNKSHAAGYVVLSFWTAYLKTHYFFEYSTAVLRSVETNKNRLPNYAEIVRAKGIKILRPDINKSKVHMSIYNFEKKEMATGFLAIKDLGEAISENIVKERELNGSFVSFEDFLKRMTSYGIDKGAVMALIYAGAFDSLEENYINLKNIYDHKYSYIKLKKDIEESVQETMYDIPEFKEMFDYLQPEINEEPYSLEEKLRYMSEYNLVNITEELTAAYKDIKNDLKDKKYRNNDPEFITKEGTVTGILLDDFKQTKKGAAYITELRLFSGETVKIILSKKDGRVERVTADEGGTLDVFKKGTVVDLNGTFKFPIVVETVEEDRDEEDDEDNNNRREDNVQPIVFPNNIYIRHIENPIVKKSFLINMDKRTFSSELTSEYFNKDIQEVLKDKFSKTSEEGYKVIVKYKGRTYEYCKDDISITLEEIKRLGYEYDVV